MNRNKLIEETMSELIGISYPQSPLLTGITTVDISQLRAVLIRISDASMDSMEVGEAVYDQGSEDIENEKIGWNAARTASQNKRAEFIK